MYEIKVAVRGELREGDAVLVFDYPAGPVPEDIEPLVFEHLIREGIAERTAVKKGASK